MDYIELNSLIEREATNEDFFPVSSTHKTRAGSIAKLIPIGEYLSINDDGLLDVNIGIQSSPEIEPEPEPPTTEGTPVYRDSWSHQNAFWNFGATNVGDTYNLEQFPPASFNGFFCEAVPIKAGDTITVQVIGGNSARAYALFDNNYVAKAIAAARLDLSITPFVTTVDYDGWLVAQCDSTFNGSYTVVSQTQKSNITKSTETQKSNKKGVQEALQSGVNIKTINGVDLLGAGDLNIEGSNYILRPFATGASFLASLYNHWFEEALESLNVTGFNAGVSGNRIKDTAIKMFNGELFTGTSWDDTDCLVIMHTHNYDVANYDTIKTNLADYVLSDFDNNNSSKSWDYVLRKYTEMRVAEGKPVNIIVCTHWHDARATYNTSIRTLQEKFGFTLIEFDKQIGFSKNATLEDGTQISTKYAVDNETIDGVVYGYHPTRTDGAYIQSKMAKIFASKLKQI